MTNESAKNKGEEECIHHKCEGETERDVHTRPLSGAGLSGALTLRSHYTRAKALKRISSWNQEVTLEQRL